MWATAPARHAAAAATGNTYGLAHVPHTPTPASTDGDLSALRWNAVFDAQRFVELPSPPPAVAHTADTSSDRFCVYSAGPVTHAGASPAPPPPFVALLLHGGGQSSLAWACVAGQLKHAVHVLAVDLRGHGHTRTQEESHLSMERMVADVVGVMRAVYPERIPPLLLIGHSLGAALAVHLTASKQLPVCGLVMVDLVEGTAVDSLFHMRGIVESRPTLFRSPEAAVAWSLRAGAVRNVTSARFSMPDQLVKGTLTEEEHKRLGHNATEGNDETTTTAVAASADAQALSSPAASSSVCYRWRTDLLSSERYWSSWFQGLSALFLGCAMPKLLLLASAERMDPPMMVAHMQGKLAVDVVQNCGHSVQEDAPVETARRILGFVARHKLASGDMAEVWARTAASASSGAAAIAAVAAATAANTRMDTPAAVASSVGHTALASQPQQQATVPPASAAITHANKHPLPPVPLFQDK